MGRIMCLAAVEHRVRGFAHIEAAAARNWLSSGLEFAGVLSKGREWDGY